MITLNHCYTRVPSLLWERAGYSSFLQVVLKKAHCYVFVSIVSEIYKEDEENMNHIAIE